ncbi:MAG: ATP-binding protein, partial [Dongiaceae bacterium]
PVVVGSRVAAVLEFYSEHPSEPDEHVLETMVQAGTHLGRVFERQWAEAALREKAGALKAKVAELELAQVELASRSAELAELAARLLLARDESNAANRAKSEFLATISHELRTPLNAIIGFSEIMKDRMFGPMGNAQYDEYAQDIHDSGRHLLGLVNDILDLSKAESGADQIREEIVEVSEVIRSTLMLVRKRAETAGVDLDVDMAGDLPALLVDKRKLTQILVNLLCNAVKFTDRGGKATLRAWSSHGSGFVFQVVDNGVGIAPEDIPKAFSRFGQIDGSLSRKHEGTGLGLPLSKALVEQHGGSLDLQSGVGVGTTVTVRFPAARILGSPASGYGLGRVAKAN